MQLLCPLFLPKKKAVSQIFIYTSLWLFHTSWCKEVKRPKLRKGHYMPLKREENREIYLLAFPWPVPAGCPVATVLGYGRSFRLHLNFSSFEKSACSGLAVRNYWVLLRNWRDGNHLQAITKKNSHGYPAREPAPLCQDIMQYIRS